MIINPNKFQAIVNKRNNKMKDSYSLNINPEVIKFGNCVKLHGVEINNKLSFEKHTVFPLISTGSQISAP